MESIGRKTQRVILFSSFPADHSFLIMLEIKYCMQQKISERRFQHFAFGQKILQGAEKGAGQFLTVKAKRQTWDLAPS